MLEKKREASEEAMQRWRTALDGASEKEGVQGGQAVQVMPTAEQVQRYLVEHRGNPMAVLQFAAQHVGPERAIAEAKNYVQQMEMLLQGG